MPPDTTRAGRHGKVAAAQRGALGAGRAGRGCAMLAAMVRTRPGVTVTDAVAGVPVAVLAVVAVWSLALAHLGHHSLAGVAVLSAGTLAAAAYALRRTALAPDRAGLAATLGCGLLAAVMFFPGFGYGAGDKDPGNYVSHAVQIARGGSYAFTDPALAHPTLPVEWENDKARVLAMWVDDPETGRIVPQFFHLWPALQATAYDVAGLGGIVALTPLVAVCGVLAFAGLLRRLAGVPGAVIGGVLLATNMLNVWQAKYPSTESFAQALYVTTLLGVVVAIEQRWRPAAAAAGALVGAGFLNRADAWLLVVLAVAALAAVWATRRADAEVVAAAAGLAVVLPYALWQAYGPGLRYTVDNGVPGLLPTIALVALAAAVSTAARRLPLGPLVDRLRDPRAQRIAGLVVCAVCFVLLVVGFLRPLAGEAYLTFDGRRTRSYDERNLHRLSWFLTLPAFALAGLGVARVALTRWRAALWAVAIPTLLLTTLYAYHARVAVRLMWWGRRYVPHVLPGLLLLVTLALVFALAWRWRRRYPLRAPAILVAATLAVVYASQSLPLRGHDEWGGSFGVAERLSALSGDRRGVYLWQRGPCCAAPSMLWSGPLWLQRGELSVLLPREPAEVPAYVAAYRAAFPGDPVYVVWESVPLPPEVAALDVRRVERFQGSMPFWLEEELRRPDRAKRVGYDFTVYEVP